MTTAVEAFEQGKSFTARSVVYLPLFLAVVSGALLCSVAAPVLTYTLSLALFGLPHVLAELKYVNARFHSRLSQPLVVKLVVLLTGLAAIRAASVFGWINSDSRAPIDLWLLFGLVIIVLPTCWARGGGGASESRLWISRSLCSICLLAVSLGIYYAPGATMIALALLHNLTPVGFLAERFSGRKRRQAMFMSFIVFFAIPAWIVTGSLWLALNNLGLTALDLSLLSKSGLEYYLPAFVFSSWRDFSFAQHMFSAAVFLQCMHYFTVIHVLGRLANLEQHEVDQHASGQQSVAVESQTSSAFKWVLIASGAVFFVAFALSFGEAKAVYSIFAGVHAWIEVPLLLICVTGLKSSTKTSLGHSV